MALIRMREVNYALVGETLLDHADFILEKGEKVGLVGRNGAGKSTLFKLLMKQIHPDSGIVEYQSGIKLGNMPQEVPQDLEGTIYEIIAGGFEHLSAKLVRYHQITASLGEAPTEAALKEMASLQSDLEHSGGFELGYKIDALIGRFGFEPDVTFTSLSGGMKRRVLLAKSLVNEPDVLFLDEPTNHLDIDSIEWLEKFIEEFPGAILVISHDRKFLDRIASRIIDLDRGKLASYTGNYEKYAQGKAHALEIEDRENKQFDKKLAEEETWIRQGIKARRTRNEGRVRALKKLRQAYTERTQLMGKANFNMQSSQLSGRINIEAKQVSYQINNKTIIKPFSTTLLRGDKVGIIGPNGSGKTTLINLLLGKVIPSSGEIRKGTKLDIVYFDQLRKTLEEDKTVRDNVGEGSDRVTINGQSRHLIGYLQDFLFSPRRANTVVSRLSGGERNRALLAKLFAKPANLIVLDEPTNDLDIETLELLESLLVEFEGTVLLVSHDRAFLNNVVTSTIGYVSPGQFANFAGGYDDYLLQRPTIEPSSSAQIATTEPAVSDNQLKRSQQKALATLTRKIERLESKQAELHDAMGVAGFYDQPEGLVQSTLESLQKIETQLNELYNEWEQLEG